jgi:hypothetical protein
MNIIIPAAGRSTRFPDLKPKWLLTDPGGNLMIVSSIEGLNLEKVENVYIAILEEHLNKHADLEGIISSFKEIGIKPKIHVLQEETSSQPETVYKTIVGEGIKGPIFIKDVDNYFKFDLKEGNYLCSYDLHDCGLVNASNKSYISLNERGLVNNIIEKKIISSNFCAGGYSFSSAEKFAKHYKKMKNGPFLYVSHVVFDMMLAGEVFYSEKVHAYCDWGTLKDWNNYKSEFMTFFLDIDGVLFENSSRFFHPKWGQSKPLKENIKFINELYDSGKICLVLTTSRKEKECCKETLKQLKDNNIKYDKIIFDLPHCKRIIVNDFSSSNPYKSCDAINVIRNGDDLRRYFLKKGN